MPISAIKTVRGQQICAKKEPVFIAGPLNTLWLNCYCFPQLFLLTAARIGILRLYIKFSEHSKQFLPASACNDPLTGAAAVEADFLWRRKKTLLSKKHLF